jgi:plasmid stability protein
MGSMVIRNIPEDVLTRLKDRAKAEGKSAEQLAREALSEKAKPSRAQIMRDAARIRAMSPPVDLETTLKIEQQLRTELAARGGGPGDFDDDR